MSKMQVSYQNDSDVNLQLRLKTVSIQKILIDQIFPIDVDWILKWKVSKIISKLIPVTLTSNIVVKRLLFERWRHDIFNRHVKWNQITWDVMKRHDESTYQNSSNIYDHLYRPNSQMGY